MKLSEVRRILKYDPVTGVLERLDRRNSGGSIDFYGYLIIKIKGIQYKAHRLAWQLHYGRSPKHVIDHKNGNKLDNRIENLRDVPQAINVLNTERKPNKDTGVVGIYKDKKTRGLKAVYTFRENGTQRRFRTLQEAIKAKYGNLTIN